MLTDTLTEENTETHFEEVLEEKIAENKLEKAEKNEHEMLEYIVEIPTGTKIEQIHALKNFLLSQEP